MSKLFTPGNIGPLTLPNRLIRSATAERMADAAGRPKPHSSSSSIGNSPGAVWG